MTAPNIDYKTLEFTHSREIDHIQAPTPEADALFSAAYAKHMQATHGSEPNQALLMEAVKGYQAAAKAGHWKAVRNLAIMNSAGVKHGQTVMVAPNKNHAFDWAQKLIQMNVGTGYNLMASFAYSGWGVKQDEEAALKYMRKAADLGNVDAQRQLGKRLFNIPKDSVPDDSQRIPIERVGFSMLACAVRQGDRESAFNLATGLEVYLKNYPYALFYYHQAGKMGDGTCLMICQEWFRDGQYGYAKDARREGRYEYYRNQTRIIGQDGPFPQLDDEIPLPPPPAGGKYPPAEWAWPNAWTEPFKGIGGEWKGVVAKPMQEKPSSP